MLHKKSPFFQKKEKKQVDRIGRRIYNEYSYIAVMDCYWEQAKPDFIS